MRKYTGRGFKPLAANLQFLSGVDKIYLNKNGKIKPYRMNAQNLKIYLNEKRIFNGLLPDMAYISYSPLDDDDPEYMGAWFNWEFIVINNYEGGIHKIRESFSTTNFGLRSLARRIRRDNRTNRIELERAKRIKDDASI